MVGAAQIAMAREDERTARYAIDSAFAGGLLDMHLGLYWLSTMAGAADVCAWLRDLEHAALLALSTGPLALALGRRELAEERLRGAVALCECMQAPAYLAIAHSEPGRMLRPSAEARACSSARAPRRSGSPCPAGPRAPMPP